MASPPTESSFAGQNKLHEIQEYLINGDHALARHLARWESVAPNLPKNMTLNIGLFAVGMLLLLADPREQHFICSLMTVPFPASQTATAVTTEKVDELKKWLTFWSIYVLFEFTDPYFATLPFYWLAKACFLVCIAIPPVNLIDQWYVEWVKPLSYVRQKKFDADVMSKCSPKLLKALEIDSVDQIKSADDKEMKAKFANINVHNVVRKMFHIRPLEDVSATSPAPS